MMRKLFCLAATLAAVVGTLLACSSAAALDLSSTFDSDAEGWTATQGGSPPSFGPAGYVASGGDPGTGFIRAVDFDQDMSPGGCCIGFFDSPPSWTGNALSNYGGALSFHLRDYNADFSPPHNGIMAAIYRGDGWPKEKLLYTGALPASGFATHSFSLTPSGWMVDDGAGGFTEPSELAFESMLANFDGVFIFWDYWTASSEVTDLDTVSWSGGSAPAPLEISRTLTIKVGKRTITGTLDADASKGDSGCAAGSHTISVYKKVKGPDKLIGTTDTESGPAPSHWSVAYKRKPGSYYATVAAFVAHDGDFDYTCLAAKSPIKKVRR
jgi:hypothetical protein